MTTNTLTPQGAIHKAFIELQHAICTLDAVAHTAKPLSVQTRADLTAYVMALEAIAERIERTEGAARVTDLATSREGWYSYFAPERAAARAAARGSVP